MDPFTISAGVVALLSPLLPALGRIGTAAADRIAERVGQAIGATAVRGAEVMWQRVAPALAERPDAAQAITALTNDPADEQARRVLAGRLAMLLDTHPELLREAAGLLAARDRHVASSVGVTIHGPDNLVQSGDGNIAITRSSGVAIHGQAHRRDQY